MKPIMNPTQLSSFSEETTLETWLRYWLCELVENALAAARSGGGAQVQILLAEHPSDPQRLRMLVADWGSGMDLDGLRNCLQLGSHPLSAHRMHEHGFGIINALSSLSGNSAPWMLATRAELVRHCRYRVTALEKHIRHLKR